MRASPQAQAVRGVNKREGSCLGILRLERRYGKERLEAACARGLLVRARSYRNIDSILRRGLDRVPLSEPEPVQAAVSHENIRGGDYYR